MREMVGGCCVCSDDRGWSENPLVYCDGQSCTVAVHQACYGIVTVPTGPWFCCKCESQDRTTKVKCELCPSKYGALKRTDNQGWAHVVCALYIPEVRFGNVSTMEPIQLHLIPAERFNKVCYICEEKGKPASATVGACMQCNKVGCKQQFHVTCAQGLGLLCEEAGNYLDNVKYCGYCQHHYSKLKKGGNVKTIPPYKPWSENHNSDSNSEKEPDGGTSLKTSPSQAAGKRRSGSGGKNSSTKVVNSSKSSGSQQKSIHSNNKGAAEKRVTSTKGTKSDEALHSTSPASDRSEKKDIKSEPVSESDKESKDKDSKGGKKRKGNSRTPTPVQSEVSVVVSAAAVSDIASTSSTLPNTSAPPLANTDKNNSLSASDSSVEKLKKAKVETTQSIISNQPVVALTSISTSKISLPLTTTATTTSGPIVSSEPVPAAIPTPSIIQTAQAQTHQPHQSLVVSVPLANTSLSPHRTLVGNPVNCLTVMPFAVASADKSGTANGTEKTTPVTPISIENLVMPSSNSNQGLLNSEMSGGGLKITYEKQPDPMNTEVDMELELEPPRAIQEVPAKRTRSQSNEKTERTTRGRKRNSLGSNGHPPSQPSTSLPATMPKRSNRSRHSSPPNAATLQQQQPGAFAAISQEKIKDSPPSSPSSESQEAPPVGQPRGRAKGRKSAPAAVNVIQGLSKEEKKEVKIFQNGATTAPHMLGNQLNPSSTMHQKMTDHLSNELEAHSIYNNSIDGSANLLGPQMHHRVVQSIHCKKQNFPVMEQSNSRTNRHIDQEGSTMTSLRDIRGDSNYPRAVGFNPDYLSHKARASSTGSSTASGGSGLSSMLSGAGGTIPQTLDQLLERQWEQGSQFLMEQAQHFDIASLLSCLHQLRAENLRLEEHVSSLLQRRDHLLAVNARLAIPLTGQPAAAPPQSSHTVNNIHPNMPVSHVEIPRTSRHSSGSYDRYPQSSLSVPMENGLPPDAYPPNTHRDSVGSGQPSPTVRHSPAAVYSNNGMLRQCADVGGRSAPPRPQPYPHYERPASAHSSSSSQQMVIRRDREREQEMFGHNSQPS